MTDIDSDDDSSGDELLNMAVPFSQQSAVSHSSPEKDGGKRSDDEGMEVIIEEVGQQHDEKKMPSKGRKRKHEDATEDAVDATEMEAKALKKAKLAFEHVIDGNVGTPDKLFWQERSKKGKKQKEIYPVRVVPPQETVGLGLRAWNDNTHSAVQYVQFPHSCMTDLSKYDAVSKRSMCPYYGAGKAKDRWCPAKFEQYSKQLKKKHRKLTALDIKAEELFLQCVLEKSLEEGESEKKMAEVDEAVPSESAAVNADDKAEEDAVESEDVSEDEGGIGRGGRPSRRSAGKMQEEKREWLRVGDRIGYFNQTCTAGDMSGYEESIIRYVDPKGERILTLDDPMTNLLPTHLVKRVQMNIRGKLVKNKDAAFRAINTYTMKKEGNPNALRDGLAERTKRVHATMQKHKENTIAAMKEDGCFMGEDFFR